MVKHLREATVSQANEVWREVDSWLNTMHTDKWWRNTSMDVVAEYIANKQGLTMFAPKKVKKEQPVRQSKSWTCGGRDLDCICPDCV